MTMTRWFYVKDNKRQGPVDLEQLVKLLLTAELPQTSLVWHQGLGEWMEAERVPEIAAELPPPLPATKAGAATTATGPAPAPFWRVPPPAPSSAEPSAASAAAARPRREELRKRLDKESGSRLFAQLAEELRKEGDLEEAIRICREGLDKHPSYPSARMTLGRALLDRGELAEARAEFELVLREAPDNLLAQKFLGECLQGLGEGAAAAPAAPSGPAEREASAEKGSPPVKGWRAWLGKLTPSPPGSEASGPPAPSSPEAREGDQPPPLPGVVPVVPGAWLEEMKEEESAPVAHPEEDLPPIPLVPAEESFELEQMHEAPPFRRAPARPPTSVPSPAAPPTPSAASTDTTVPPPVPEARPPAEPAPPPVSEEIPEKPAAASALRTTFSSAPTPARRASAAAGAAPWPTWSLAEKDFPDLVQALHERRWTGLLVINHMAMEKIVTVQDGRLVFASSSSRDDRLGELLLRKGRITLRQYLDAGREIRKGKRLGAILVEQGALDAKDLVKVVVEHTKEIICGLFLWTEGVYQLQDSVQSPEAITLKLSTPDIILEGIRRIESWNRIERGVGGVEARYERSPNYLHEMQEMTLSPEKLALLMNLEEPRDVQAICEGSALPHFEVCRTLWAFRVIGVIRRVDG